MTESTPVPEAAADALARLHDEPDEHLAALTERMPADDEVAGQKAVFAALANEKRLRILGALREGERCVCELQAVLDAPQSTVATHLRTLKEAGLVAARKQGKWRYYRIADTATFELLDLAAAVDAEA